MSNLKPTRYRALDQAGAVARAQLKHLRVLTKEMSDEAKQIEQEQPPQSRCKESRMSSDELKDFKRKIADIFIKRTKNRTRWKGANGCGGYKKWEADILRLCGYEFKDGAWHGIEIL